MKMLPLMIAVLAAGLLTGARVPKPRVIALPVPAAAHPNVSRGVICLGAVEDSREFAANAKDRSLPSLAGDLAQSTAAERNVVIGRRRSAFGKAAGNVVLAAGDSVALRVRALIEEALRRRGYVVGADPNAPVVVTATVDRFWAWPQPDYWGVTLTARVGCVLTIRRGDAVTKVRVEGESRNAGQTSSDASWQQAYAEAFRAVLLELGDELARNGL